MAKNFPESRRYLDKLSMKDYDNDEFPKAHYLAGMHYITCHDSYYHKKAFEHFNAAAQKDDEDAQYTMGVLLYAGERVEIKNQSEGMKWIQKAAENGSEEAKTFLDSREERNRLIADAVKEIISDRDYYST